MTEKLGVLLVDVPEPSLKYNYLCYEKLDCNKEPLTVDSTDDKWAVSFYGIQCTQEEAKNTHNSGGYRWRNYEY